MASFPMPYRFEKFLFALEFSDDARICSVIYRLYIATIETILAPAPSVFFSVTPAPYAVIWA